MIRSVGGFLCSFRKRHVIPYDGNRLLGGQVYSYNHFMSFVRLFGSQIYPKLALPLVIAGVCLQVVQPFLRAQTNTPAISSQPSATAAASSAVSASYVLSANDAVQIDVFQEDDLRTTAVISKDGTINFPLLNSVKIGGLTQAQARDLITEKLRADYLVNPQVSFAVVRFASKRFTVLGQINRPGSFELPAQESIDLLEAIAMAGGYTRIAEPGKITVKRRIGDKEQIFNVNAKRMAKNLGTERFAIEPGDTITVAESIF